MPRNDQVTRQWLLLQKLETSRGATLQELSASLPEDLSRHPRTIRRDLEALEAAHIPLITERNNGQTRWRLMDGYRQVLPLSLSPTELMALVFSRDLLKSLEGTELKASLDSALNKAAAALPAEGTRYIEQLRGHFSVGVGAHKPYREHRQTIDQLSQAIAQTRTVQMRYYTRFAMGTDSPADADPWELIHHLGCRKLPRQPLTHPPLCAPWCATVHHRTERLHDPTTAAHLGALERGLTWAVVQIAGVGTELHPRL